MQLMHSESVVDIVIVVTKMYIALDHMVNTSHCICGTFIDILTPLMHIT